MSTFAMQMCTCLPRKCVQFCYANLTTFASSQLSSLLKPKNVKTPKEFDTTIDESIKDKKTEPRGY